LAILKAARPGEVLILGLFLRPRAYSGRIKLEPAELAAALTIMGVDRKPEIVFYAFVSLPEGRMSTRKGRVVYIDDLIDEAVERAYDEVKKRRTDLSEERMREIAKAVKG